MIVNEDFYKVWAQKEYKKSTNVTLQYMHQNYPSSINKTWAEDVLKKTV